jgi:flagellar basal-body rod modification protein FlgD
MPSTSDASAISAISAASNSTLVSTMASTTKATQLDKDMFLKLLVTQLKYQDPSNPSDANQFLAQTAQFSTVERLDQLATTNSEMLTAQLLVGAGSLVGRTVHYLNDAGKDTVGVVTGATFAAGTAKLRIDGKDVPLASISQVVASTGTTTPTA